MRIKRAWPCKPCQTFMSYCNCLHTFISVRDAPPYIGIQTPWFNERNLTQLASSKRSAWLYPASFVALIRARVLPAVSPRCLVFHVGLVDLSAVKAKRVHSESTTSIQKQLTTIQTIVGLATVGSSDLFLLKVIDEAGICKLWIARLVVGNAISLLEGLGSQCCTWALVFALLYVMLWMQRNRKDKNREYVAFHVIWHYCIRISNATSFAAYSKNITSFMYYFFLLNKCSSVEDLPRTAFKAIFKCLGKLYEHQRTDRDKYVEIIWNNVRLCKCCKYITKLENYKTMNILK